jgi:hypothetical protein
MRALLRDGSSNSQLSKLWRGDFFRLADLPILRIKIGDRRVSIVLWHDVHRQQILSALRGSAGATDGRGTVDIEVSTVQGRYVVSHDWRRTDA